jgi:D-3-phosphoglycerate dehydrogenase
MVPDLDALLPKVDFLTIHTPLIASTLDLISEAELKKMKPTARVLNVARGGVFNEQALLEALDAGTIAGAGLDVFTSEPPTPGSPAEALTRHALVVSTPHLGASTVEAQENVSLDVCTQVLSILRGGLPTSAVNAPLILPEEYKKLQPFVKLVERMGSLYTQHYGRKSSAGVGGKSFDLVYEGELAGISNTKPLFAALVKGLTSVISDQGGRDVNIVNASQIAQQKGIKISESFHRVPDSAGSHGAYASLVTLRTTGGGKEQVISGYVSGNAIYIAKLDRFTASFVPEGTLLICHNYDSPGKIGSVGALLGKREVNINFMSVAALDTRGSPDTTPPNETVEGQEVAAGKKADEALMILGVSGTVDKELVRELREQEGILDVSVVHL